MVADPEKQYPRIVCRNLDHFEPVILPEESREAAALLYQNLRPSGNIALLDSDTPAPRTAADDERSLSRGKSDQMTEEIQVSRLELRWQYIELEIILVDIFR